MASRVSVAALAFLAAVGCREAFFDIVTSERVVRVPESGAATFTVETGRIALPATLGEDKTVDRATLDLEATNFNADNPVTVDLAIADARALNAFRDVASFELAPGETRRVVTTQTAPNDPVVRATQSSAINVRFDSRSPRSGIGAIEFRFVVRVEAHKETPGMGPGSLLLY